MSGVVYSFFDGKIRERLREHVDCALRTFSNSSRIVKLGSKLNENFYLLLGYSIILHDFGKVYFNQLPMVNPDKISFEGHEIISAWFANEYLRYFVDKGVLSKRDKGLVVLAILFHHHPMNLRKRAELLENAIQRRKRGSEKQVQERLTKETLRLFYEELNGIVEPIDMLLDKEIMDIINETIGARNITQAKGILFRDLWSDLWMNSEPRIRKSFLLLTQGLIVADYTAASKIRGEGKSEFARTISVYLEKWG